jgi:hypothetical protein
MANLHRTAFPSTYDSHALLRSEDLVTLHKLLDDTCESMRLSS